MIPALESKAQKCATKEWAKAAFPGHRTWKQSDWKVGR